MQLGDLELLGTPKPKLLKAIAVIASELHPAFDRQPGLKPLISRQSCVLVSLAICDFLHGIGFATARARPVAFVAWAERDSRQLHSAAIGSPGDKRKTGGWTGHMVVTVQGWLIDATLYQINRPVWHELPGMMALQLNARPWTRGWWHLDLMAHQSARQEDGSELLLGWFDNPKNTSWRNGGDGRDASRRAPVVRELIERFGKWER